MIDLHCHVLPGLDDGAASLDVSRGMLERMRELGITKVVATPHLAGPLDPGYARRVETAFAQVEPIAAEHGIELVQGFEIRLTPDLAGRLAAGEPSTLGASRTVLVDFACMELPLFVDDALFAVQSAGFVPILAHPERYPNVQRDPRLALQWSARGVALQVTAGSLGGAFGKSAKKAAEALLRLGAAHIVATDAHSVGRRMEAVAPGLQRLHELVGKDQFHLAAEGNVRALLEGTIPEPITAAEQGFWGRLLSLR